MYSRLAPGGVATAEADVTLDGTGLSADLESAPSAGEDAEPVGKPF